MNYFIQAVGETGTVGITYHEMIALVREFFAERTELALLELENERRLSFVLDDVNVLLTIG